MGETIGLEKANTPTAGKKCCNYHKLQIGNVYTFCLVMWVSLKFIIWCRKRKDDHIYIFVKSESTITILFIHSTRVLNKFSNFLLVAEFDRNLMISILLTTVRWEMGIRKMLFLYNISISSQFQMFQYFNKIF